MHYKLITVTPGYRRQLGQRALMDFIQARYLAGCGDETMMIVTPDDVVERCQKYEWDIDKIGFNMYAVIDERPVPLTLTIQQWYDIFFETGDYSNVRL